MRPVAPLRRNVASRAAASEEQAMREAQERWQDNVRPVHPSVPLIVTFTCCPLDLHVRQGRVRNISGKDIKSMVA
eukprot:scaffold664557_cov126-Prasinocladus_malaysianus.AAC.1